MILIKLSDSVVINIDCIVCYSVVNVRGWEIHFHTGNAKYNYRLRTETTEAIAKKFFDKVCCEICASPQNHVLSIESLEADFMKEYFDSSGGAHITV